jgi:aryl-alcohol dehydrogenase-like predicted oxidoreductase
MAAELPTSVLGRTGLRVTKLGFGAMELRGAAGWPQLDEPTAGAVLNGVLDAGINYIDTSPDYGISEERIGRHISGRRDEFFLASKCGCLLDPAAPPGHPHDFTRENVRAGVESSLRRMRTDHLDLVQFHQSPSPEVLERDDSLAELDDLRREGKVRFIGMSGTLPNLPEQIELGAFDAFQIPYSALERDLEELIGAAAAAGAGVVVRGGVARGVAAATGDPVARSPEAVRASLQKRKQRLDQTKLDDLLEGMAPMEFMLRFTLSHPDMHTTIVGTSSLDHLRANAAAARKGPLPPELYEAAKVRLAQPAKDGA